MTMLSVEAQMGYLVQWFTEWSDLQRTDFLPVLAEKLSNVTYVNGIVNSISGVNCQDKPMSLFECRVCIFSLLTKNSIFTLVFLYSDLEYILNIALR